MTPFTMLFFAYAVLCACVVNSDAFTMKGKICKGKGQSFVTSIPSHNYCKHHDLAKMESTVKKVYIVKHSFIRPEVEACLCTASKLEKKCEVWFFGSWETTITHEVIQSTDLQCRDACREMYHRNEKVYTNATDIEAVCKWNAVTVVSTNAIQAEKIKVIENVVTGELTYPGLNGPKCVLPVKANTLCAGKTLKIMFRDDVQVSPCPSEVYPAGDCAQTMINTKTGPRLFRLNCPSLAIVDYFSEDDRAPMCSHILQTGHVYRTKGNLVIAMIADDITKHTDKADAFDSASPARNWILHSNTDLSNQLVMGAEARTAQEVNLAVRTFEKQLCETWKSLLVTSTALLETSPSKSAEILVGKRDHYKVTRVLNSIYWTPCYMVNVTFNKTNEKCLKNWPVVTEDGNTLYYDSLNKEVTSITSSIPCEQVNPYYVDVEGLGYYDLVSGVYSNEEYDDSTGSESMPNEEVITTMSLYNITDHESIGSFDLLTGMIYETVAGHSTKWIKSTWNGGEKTQMTQSKGFELPGIDSFLKRLLPDWLYNIGDIIKTILEIVVFVILLRFGVPLIADTYRKTKCNIRRGKHKRLSIADIRRLPTKEELDGFSGFNGNDEENRISRPFATAPVPTTVRFEDDNKARRSIMKGVSVNTLQSENEYATSVETGMSRQSLSASRRSLYPDLDDQINVLSQSMVPYNSIPAPQHQGIQFKSGIRLTEYEEYQRKHNMGNLNT